MLLLHGSLLSTCTGRALLAFAEIGLKDGVDYKLVEVVKLADLKSPEWLENQPFAEMPYLIDDETGEVIYESRAIAKYAAAKFKSPLLPIPTPDELSAWAKFEIAASVETSNFDPYMKTLFLEAFVGPKRGRQVNQDKVNHAESSLRERLEGYERILSKQAFIAGNRLTLVDLFHIPYIDVLSVGKAQALVDGSLPNVAKWWKGLQDLETWRVIHRRRQEVLRSFKMPQ